VLIACDVDDVVADLSAAWYGAYNQDYGDALKPDAVASWDLHLYVKQECGAKIYDYLLDPHLYERVEPVKGAIEGVQRLMQMGHEVVFVTANVYGMTDQKARWLERHGFVRGDGRQLFLPRELVVARDKSLLDADLLIDDGPHHVVSWVGRRRRRALLFDRPHNRKLDDEVPSAFWAYCTRVCSWEEIVAEVGKLLGGEVGNGRT
jgi:5'(3')-deoxyribonucleotidase